MDTIGGRHYAEWDTGAPVTREGQLNFFSQLLHTGAGQGQWKGLKENGINVTFNYLPLTPSEYAVRMANGEWWNAQ